MQLWVADDLIISTLNDLTLTAISSDNMLTVDEKWFLFKGRLVPPTSTFLKPLSQQKKLLMTIMLAT